MVGVLLGVIGLAVAIAGMVWIIILARANLEKDLKARIEKDSETLVDKID